MSVSPAQPPPIPLSPPVPSRAPAPAPVPAKALRRLFLTLFLRGRSARGLKKESTPKSIGSKLALALVMYVFFGMFSLSFLSLPVMALSIYLHGMTMVFLGLFVASSAGEVLFNKEEADILLHRPVTARELLWAKISVLVQVTLWLAGALNFVGFFVGVWTSNGGWLFPLVHAASVTLEALFCTGAVVVAYQLCLRWFGRERLDGLMTTAQMAVSILVVVSGQLVPRMIGPLRGNVGVLLNAWWIDLLPPAWFAGLDDALAGSGAWISWMLASFGMVATVVVVWLAFGKLSQDYGKGLQNLSVSATRKSRRAQRRWIDVLVHMPPLNWWLRDSVSRASFLLTAAYLLRDRDVKLRVYPGLAPMLVMPFIFLLQSDRDSGFGAFGMAFTGAYVGLIPLIALDMLRFSQHWQAADLFRVAPMTGPAPLCHGARRAVLCFLALPMVVLFGVIGWLMTRHPVDLLLMVPGLLLLPVYALVPCQDGKAVPLSEPTEEGQAANRGLKMMLIMVISFALAGIAFWAWNGGWFKVFLPLESVAVVGAYAILRVSVASARWSSME